MPFRAIFKGEQANLAEKARSYFRLRLGVVYGVKAELEAIQAFQPHKEKLEILVKEWVDHYDVKTANMIKQGQFPSVFENDSVQLITTFPQPSNYNVLMLLLC